MTPPDGPAPPPPRRQGLARRLALVGGALVLAFALAALALSGPLLRGAIVAEASSQGLSLEPGAISFRWGRLELRGARFGLRGERVLSGQAELVVIGLSGLSPRSVEASGVRVALLGTPGEVAGALSRWQQSTGGGGRAGGGGAGLSISATGLDASWADAPGEAPWARVAGASVSPTPGGGRLHAAEARAGGSPMGQLDLAWQKTPEALVLAPGAGDPYSSSIYMVIPYGQVPTARAVARGARVGELLKLAGGKAPSAAERSTLDGTLELRFPEAGGLDGALEATLRGYSPPVPRELAGLVSSQSTLTATLKGARGQSQLSLSPITLTSGSVRLSGSGALRREGGKETLQARLDGAVPCSLLARSAATADFGGLVGGLVGTVASAAMEGSVAISLAVDADSQSPSSARVRPSFGVGCGLRLP